MAYLRKVGPALQARQGLFSRSSMNARARLGELAPTAQSGTGGSLLDQIIKGVTTLAPQYLQYRTARARAAAGQPPMEEPVPIEAQAASSSFGNIAMIAGAAILGGVVLLKVFRRR